MDFKNIKEFNEIWKKFLFESGRQSYKAPHCPRVQEIKDAYLRTNRWAWFAETMRLWLIYKDNYLAKNQ